MSREIIFNLLVSLTKERLGVGLVIVGLGLDKAPWGRIWVVHHRVLTDVRRTFSGATSAGGGEAGSRCWGRSSSVSLAAMCAMRSFRSFWDRPRRTELLWRCAACTAAAAVPLAERWGDFLSTETLRPGILASPITSLMRRL